MMLDEIPQYIVDLAKRLGATDVTAKLTESRRIMIRFSNNEVTVSKAFLENSVDIFVMIEKHRAATTISTLSIRNIKKAVENLIRMAKSTPPADVYAPLPQGPFTYNPDLMRAPKIPLDPDNLAVYVESAIKSALEKGATRAAGTLNAYRSRITLATSGDVYASQEKASMEISIRAFVSDLATGHAVSVASKLEDFHPEEAGSMAGEIAKAASNPKPGEPGKYMALLGPMVLADIVNQVGSLSSAFLVDAGQSFLVDKMNSEVASERFTLIDDPTLAGSLGARAFDDEGVPTKRNIIIENGILKTYLHNTITAKKFGVETTGNAGIIVPYPWNLIVEPGYKSPEDLLAEIDDGIYVTNDWYLRYQDYRAGDFSTIPRDGMFRIRNGEIAESIRELRISDNMLRLLRNIVDLSRLRMWVKWWEVEVPTLAPYALISELNFTKSAM
ncbi:MAG: TldD/PmbA family protein [Candidatus Bathyarchaeota archaeon]|nr:TldD/PmbA family protein [Candidatus Bathyarchaeota archaeon]